MPVGPSILWLVNAMKSTPSACTSTGQCGTLCDASTSTSAPAWWAARAISSTGLIVPSTFEMWTNADELDASVLEQARQGGPIQLAVIGDRQVTDLDSALLAQRCATAPGSSGAPSR